jgi:pilus assembly protein Flp/PilA
MATIFRRFWRDENGATMVEYGLMVLLVATAAASAVLVFGQSVLGLFMAVPPGL